MTDHKPSEPSPNDFKETADKSLAAGIADERAAYEKAIDSGDADDEVTQSKWKSSEDGSGKS